LFYLPTVQLHLITCVFLAPIFVCCSSCLFSALMDHIPGTESGKCGSAFAYTVVLMWRWLGMKVTSQAEYLTIDRCHAQLTLRAEACSFNRTLAIMLPETQMTINIPGMKLMLVCQQRATCSYLTSPHSKLRH